MKMLFSCPFEVYYFLRFPQIELFLYSAHNYPLGRDVLESGTRFVHRHISFRNSASPFMSENGLECINISITIRPGSVTSNTAARTSGLCSFRKKNLRYFLLFLVLRCLAGAGPLSKPKEEPKKRRYFLSAFSLKELFVAFII